MKLQHNARANKPSSPLACSLLLGLLLGGTAQAQDLSTPQSVVSDRADMDFNALDAYFKAPGSNQSATQFSASLNTCLQSNINEIKGKGGLAPVMKATGYTETSVIEIGSRVCMEAKGWKLYKVINNNVEQVNEHLRAYSTLSPLQLKVSADMIVEMRQTYAENEPEVLAVGDLTR